jgi:hypothetical protein
MCMCMYTEEQTRKVRYVTFCIPLTVVLKLYSQSVRYDTIRYFCSMLSLSYCAKRYKRTWTSERCEYNTITKEKEKRERKVHDDPKYSNFFSAIICWTKHNTTETLFLLLACLLLAVACFYFRCYFRCFVLRYVQCHVILQSAIVSNPT